MYIIEKQVGISFEYAYANSTYDWVKVDVSTSQDESIKLCDRFYESDKNNTYRVINEYKKNEIVYERKYTVREQA